MAKYNQELGDKLDKEFKQLKDHSKDEIANNERFLTAVENKLGIKHPIDESVSLEPIVQSKFDVPDWEQLKNEARANILYDVDYEDLLTSDEIANAYRHLDEINEQFAKKTGFKKGDLIFLVTAIALQCTRQYVIGPWLKKLRSDASADDEKGRKGKAEPGWYYVATENILTNSVPFDATAYGEADSIQDFLKGGNHRTMTLGHDPLLGWIFGTANILTSTLTRASWNLASAHVKYQPGRGNVIHSLADIRKIFIACKERLFDEGLEGKLAVGLGIIREAIHLKSDIGTKSSLPIPTIPTASPEFAKELARYGIDTASVGTEIGLSALINALISMVHRLFYDESVDDPKLYEVRTRKILLLSNTIASTSNVIVTAFTKNPKILDVGGLIVTITRLVSDVRFICKVKQEFIQSALDVHFQGIVEELEQMYKNETST
ncbi:MAG: hypothetical protein FWB91_11290 [Defluviitaleaceae bacterium]|nr:hypothetical protein [Defluviitaleaceae bacterium]